MDEINLDLTQRVLVNTTKQAWFGSRADGVQRKPLEREAAESGRTTSVVQFMPGSAFPPHQHPQGEEIFVLEGVFSDECGDYPAGSYLRNPPGSQHAPFSKEGCVLFVKLEQFQPGDTQTLAINTQGQAWQAGHGGLKVMGLHQYGTEHTALVWWPAGEVFQPHTHYGGEEIFVLEGEFIDEHGRYPKGSWLRSPHASRHHPYVEQDTLIWVKTGHL
ncbi:cupin domain-containing protein [Thiomicrospira sp. ALE5]|uniref:cupin domain-containing protein n=1 Tax=Thiomicrospira sp. ALE5 TaxID=748650 RepID=UPI0008EC3B7F|nr:cupin domain-containing protein [Thiomicrospira sp. ALE5]SFR54926.1 Anti-sigma factor ChrR, cupin superfamily [Thiomicrospira sp. ALE5]